jgi:hypothetical protein
MFDRLLTAAFVLALVLLAGTGIGSCSTCCSQGDRSHLHVVVMR